MDLVATCWDTQNLMNADAIDRQEIIGKLSGDCKKINLFHFYLIFFVIWNFEVFFNSSFFLHSLSWTEFPAVLLNLQSRVIEADFHTFVRPTEQPKLSEFCKNYTGITQDDVDNAPTLAEVLRMFHEWIQSFRHSKGIVLMDDTKRKQNTVFITWTDFDLGIYLPTESGRKKIKLPPYMSRWIDLRDYYSVSISDTCDKTIFTTNKQFQ